MAEASGVPSTVVPTTYLITGGAGFIGSHLADHLVERGDRVLVLDDLSGGSEGNLRGALEAGGSRLVCGSVRDPSLVERCMREADVCIHLAAALGVKRIVSDPLEALLCNVRGTDIVMAAAAHLGRRLLFASSSEVYGKRSGDALTEDDDCTIGAASRSRWSYAIAKQFGEALAHAYKHDTGADFTSIRFFNIVGPRQSPAYGMVLPRFVSQALANRPLTIYGSGSQSRCFTSVHDAVSAVDGLLSTESVAGETYNVGVSTPTQIAELARRVISRTGSRSKTAFIPYEQAYGAGYEELGSRVPDTGALRARTGWAPQRSIDEMVDEVIHSQRQLQLAGSRAAEPPWAGATPRAA